MNLFAKLLLAGTGTLLAQAASAQAVYDNFESKRVVQYPNNSGTLNQAAANPDAKANNRSAVCASYTRNPSVPYDYIIVKPAKMGDVSAYVSGEKRLSMKFRTPAAGTVVQIALQNTAKAQGAKHPLGRFAGSFKATSTIADAWETLVFTFVPASPENLDPTVGPKDVDRLVISIAPNSNSGETFYFDDLMGPE